MSIEEQIKILDEICPFFRKKAYNKSVRHDFFKNIQTEIQAYLLGFFAADGNMNNTRYNLRIKLTEQDSEIIDLYKFYISPEAYTRHLSNFDFINRGQVRHTKNSIECNIASTTIWNDIFNLGYRPNKTYLEQHIPINIPNNLLNHFIRGYFDGDGSFSACIAEPNRKNREINKKLRTYFSICAKRTEILEDIQRVFQNNNINTKIYPCRRDDMYVLATASKKECKKVFDYLYQDFNFCLTRKYNKFNYYINTEVKQIISDYCNAQNENSTSIK